MYARIPRQEADYYQRLKRALIIRFDNSEDGYRQISVERMSERDERLQSSYDILGCNLDRENLDRYENYNEHYDDIESSENEFDDVKDITVLEIYEDSLNYEYEFDLHFIF